MTGDYFTCWHQRFTHYVLGPPFPYCCWFGESCYSLSCETEPTPLVKLYLFFLPHLVNRNANSQRSAGRTGQAEMPICLGVSPPRQVVPGLHSRPYLYVRLFLWIVSIIFSSFKESTTVKLFSQLLLIATIILKGTYYSHFQFYILFWDSTSLASLNLQCPWVHP